MAHIRRRKTGWQVRYRDPFGQERARNFRLKSDAEKFLVTVEVDKLRGEWTDPRLGRITFGEWCEQYQATRINRRPSTRARDESTLKNQVLPALAPLPLASVQPLQIQRWLAELEARGYAAATIRKAYQLTAAAFEAAVTSGLIPRSPCRGVKLPKVETTEMRFLDRDEVDTLAAAITPRYRALVLTAAGTGLRFGELAGLRVDRLNMLRRSLRVEETLVEVGALLYFGPPKSMAARRTLSLPGFVVDAVAAHLAGYGSPDGLVFTTSTDGPIRRTNFRNRHWLPAVHASVGRPCRVHDLRHSHAALLIREGVHPKVIQERLGHASIKTTLDVYGHLFDGLDQAAADALNAAWSRPSAPMSART